jgi:CBS domain-containing protein
MGWKGATMLPQTAVFTRLVREHMGPPPVSVRPGASCAEVVRRMREGRASGCVVEGADGRIDGIVTEQDVCRRIAHRATPETPVEEVMSTPVRAIHDDDYLYHAIARMRRGRLRHMPVVDRRGRAVGILQLHEALAVAAMRMASQIDRLTHEETLEGMRDTKGAQVDVGAELLHDQVPTPEIQGLVSFINNDLYNRVVKLCLRGMHDDGWGEPPVSFDVVIMGSGGRGESYLFPDQDNGFILEDYPDEEHARIDPWFIELAERMTRMLNEVGFEYCRGHVMATNPLWRKSISQWRTQVTRWIGASTGQVLRLADIFFDFLPVYGDGALTAQLREHVTAIAWRPVFLREMYKVDEEHGVALGLFGRLQTETREGPDKGKVNLKLTGTLPLVGAVRLLALRERVPETSTLARIAGLHAKGVLDTSEQEYIHGAFRHITHLLLRQQITDFKAGQPVSNYVPPQALSKRERKLLVDSFKAIRALRTRVRGELMADVL